MKQEELARELAGKLPKKTRLPQAVAQDQIDKLVHQIVRKLRRGHPVELPGLGKLVVPARPRKRQ